MHQFQPSRTRRCLSGLFISTINRVICPRPPLHREGQVGGGCVRVRRKPSLCNIASRPRCILFWQSSPPTSKAFHRSLECNSANSESAKGLITRRRAVVCRRSYCISAHCDGFALWKCVRLGIKGCVSGFACVNSRGMQQSCSESCCVSEMKGSKN